MFSFAFDLHITCFFPLRTDIIHNKTSNSVHLASFLYSKKFRFCSELLIFSNCTSWQRFSGLLKRVRVNSERRLLVSPYPSVLTWMGFGDICHWHLYEKSIEKLQNRALYMQTEVCMYY